MNQDNTDIPPIDPADDLQSTAPVAKDNKYDDHGAAWYVVYTMGHEDKVKQQVLKRAENMDAKDKILEIHVPKKTMTKVQSGKRVEKEVTHYQRYIFVNMILDNSTYPVVRHTPGVLSIIEQPLSKVEVARIFGRKKTKFAEAKAAEDTQYTVNFAEGDEVRIEGGAFDGFTGEAKNVDLEHGKVTVMISVFGRFTPVDLTLDQVHPVSEY